MIIPHLLVTLDLTTLRPARTVLAVMVAITLVFMAISPILFMIGLALTLLAGAFYNDATRQIPEGSGLALAPIDGHITGITRNVGLPFAFDQAKDQTENFIRIDANQRLVAPRIFRAPLAGTIREILRYTPDEDNETKTDWSRMDGVAILVETPDNAEYALVINAPLIPQQIHLKVKVGDTVQPGDRLGIVLLYATSQLYLRNPAPLLRTTGHQIVAGETVLQAATFQGTPLYRGV